MKGLLKPCLSCGNLSEQSRCETCQPLAEATRTRDHTKTSEQRAHDNAKYDQQWRRLSARARRMQGYCDDCGTTEDLTTDHSTEAWEAKAEGLPITLAMVSVVCRSCNAKRGKTYVSA